MRFKRIDLLRYGHFSDYSFELPLKDKDIHILFGRNEAGKSTTLSAIEDFLFGIGNNSPYNFKHDNSDMRIGASIENQDSSFEAFRRKGNKNTLMDKDDQSIEKGEETLRSFLLGTDRSFYERMFSLDRLRLEQGGRQILDAKDEVGEMLFEAGSGISGIRNKLSNLKDEADNLWATRKSKNKKYYQLVEKLKDAEREIRDNTVSTHKWSELKSEYDKTEEKYNEIAAEHEQKSVELSRISRIRRVYPHVITKEELEKNIQNLGDVILLPEEAKEIVENSDSNQRIILAKIQTLEKELNQHQEDLKDMNFDEQLLLREDDINKLHEMRIQIRGGKNDLPRRQAELNQQEKNLLEIAQQLVWQEEDISKLINRIPNQSKIGLARSFISKRGEAETNFINKENVLKELSDEQELVKQNLKSINNITNVARLKSIIKKIKERGDISTQRQTAHNQVKSFQRRIDSLISYFNPTISFEELTSDLKVPTSEDVNIHRDLLQEWDTLHSEKKRKIREIEEKLNRIKINYQQVIDDEHPISDHEFEDALKRRDSLWNLVKMKYINNKQVSKEDLRSLNIELENLISEFEDALKKVDNISKEKFEKAQTAGKLKQMDQNINENEEELKLLTNHYDKIVKDGDEL